MSRQAACLLLGVVLCAAQADPIRINYRLGGGKIGTNTYDARADGSFESTTELDVGFKIASKLTGWFSGGKLVSYTLEEQTPQGASTVTFADGKAKLVAGGKHLDREVKGVGEALFANYHPQVSAQLVAQASKSTELVEFSTLFIDGAVVRPLKAKSEPGPALVHNGRAIQLTRVLVSLGPLDLHFATDREGRIVGISAPSQKLIAEAEGFEGVFVDPLAAYPELSQPTHAVQTLRGARIKMRDGIELAHDLVRPAGDGHWPTILVRTPYGKLLAQLQGEFWAKRGYAFIAQDCRGREESAGEWDPCVREGRDGYDTIEWIAKQPWSDGKVGMIGGSYGGLVQWAAAVEQPPALKCIVPQVSPPDAMRNMPYDNGVPMLLGAMWWDNLVRDQNTHMEDAGKPPPHGARLTELPLLGLDEKVMGRPMPHFRTWLKRETYADWAGFDYLKDVPKVTIPVLHISGWWDGDEIGTQLNWSLSREAGKTNQWLIYGPWPHAFNSVSRLGDVDYGPTAILELDSVFLRWFDTWLKDKPAGFDRQPKVRAFLTGENRWHDLADWPDASAEAPRTLFLSSDRLAAGAFGGGKLVEQPAAGQAPDGYSYDPGSVKVPKSVVEGNPVDDDLRLHLATDKSDYLVYKTERLAAPLTVAAPIALDLFFSTTATDTDFFAFLADEDELGRMHFIGQPGKIRGSYLASLDRREPLVPGKEYRATIQLWDTAHRFAPGHRMVLVVVSQMFPAYARNLNVFQPLATGTKMAVARQTIYHDALRPSALHFWSLK
ncbi:MAG: CocE/NonD family hydrolase [Fimbriimonas ginsengisoli]|uniref:CocE/NonD family hydrolase n=1 Tax=Fimbriimonas ginsengisoli TaxID=1005039 RepID=A0A931PT55_FIMGI|nr:CocE/NonD family hydrolase [Fimbriimonas ginsengisoli]